MTSMKVKNRTSQLRIGLPPVVSSSEPPARTLRGGSLLTRVLPAKKGYQIAHFHVDQFGAFLIWDAPADKKKDTRPLQELLALGTIVEVRAGQKTDGFRQNSKVSDKAAASFSIVYHDSKEWRTLDLIAESELMRDTWLAGLAVLMDAHDKVDGADYTTNYERVRYEWAHLNLRDDQTVPLKELLDFPERSLGLSIPPTAFKAIVFAVAKQQGLEDYRITDVDFATFQQTYDSLASRTADLKILFGNEKDEITLKEMQYFLLHKQCAPEAVLESDCREIITDFEPDQTLRNQNKISLHAFGIYLLSDRETFFHPKDRTVNQTMTLPLRHYYIKTAHEPMMYSGWQSGESVEGLIRVLLGGFRCIRLQVWQGSGNKPFVYPAHCPGIKTRLELALDAIFDYGFRVTHYPLFLVLSGNDLSAKCIGYVASALAHSLGSHLDAVPEFSSSLSPEDLRNKVLLVNELSEKPKKGPSVVNSTAIGGEQPVFSLGRAQTSLDDASNCPSGWGIWHHSMVDAESYHSSRLDDYRAVACEHLVLVDPTVSSVTTTGSSSSSRKDTLASTDPMKLWHAGVQMVGVTPSLNDLAFQLSESRFRANGGCGYILRPRDLRVSASELARGDDNMDHSSAAMIVGMQVVSGQQLRPSIFDSRCFHPLLAKEAKKVAAERNATKMRPKVLIDVIGTGPDAADSHKFETAPAEGTFNPVWHDAKQVAKFEVILDEFAFVRFRVIDETSGRPLGHSIVPFSSINEGYRHLRLRNEYEQLIDGSTLFLYTNIRHMSIINGRQRLRLSDLEELSEWPIQSNKSALPDPWCFLGESGRSLFEKVAVESTEVAQIAEMMMSFAGKSRDVLMVGDAISSDLGSALEKAGAIAHGTAVLANYRVHYYRLPKTPHAFTLCNIFQPLEDGQDQWKCHFFLY